MRRAALFAIPVGLVSACSYTHDFTSLPGAPCETNADCTAPATCGGGGVAGACGTCNCWVSQPSLPQPRSYPAVAGLGETLFVAGGFDGTRESATLQIFDPDAGQWSMGAPLPAGRYETDASTWIGGILYLPGGWTVMPPIPNNTLFSYDPAVNHWSSLATMPQLSGCGVSVTLGGILYATSPCNGASGYQAILDAYDPSSNQWTAMPPAPHAHASGFGAAVDGMLYLAGGFGGATGTPSPFVDIYDPVSRGWSSGAAMPTNRASGCSAFLDGGWYLLGGSEGAGSLATVDVYDPATDQWSAGQPMPTARSNCGAGVIDGVIYVVGGDVNGQAAPVSSVEAYTP